MFLKGQWDTATFVTNYLPLALFPLLYAGARVWRRSHFVRPLDMDFVTDVAEVEAASYDEPPQRNWVERVWAWLVSVPFHVGMLQAAHTRHVDVERLFCAFHAYFATNNIRRII